jgi:2-keto-4-pentenoate hydratase/2-oxohepta-3-ene-1,7-dioic acid hydratase in catechol pathway
LLRVHTDAGLRDAVLTEDGRVATLEGEVEAAYDVDRLRERAAGADVETATAFEDARLASPLSPGKIVCVGLNYADHAAEGGQDAPAEPILFMKAPDTVVSAHDDVVIPRGSEKTDWEVELGVVIGRTAAYLESEAEALDYVAGYVLVNDVSERHFQLERGGQWDKGKNAPTFCPIGPWVLTADEVPDPQAIKLGLDVNGDVLQDSSTAQMIFSVAHLVHYISQFMTLYPGDVISTGTPAGVGAGQKPPRFLRAGDVLRVWADGLGEQHTRLA